MKLRVFTAFSGYDSQCMALDRLKKTHPYFDYELVGWSEFDPDSKSPIERQPAVIAHNAVYPQWRDRNYGDVSKIDWDKVPDFDLFTYSFPCQDISNAGLQKGFREDTGTRSSMLWECRKAILKKKPKWMIMENVKALLAKKNMGMFRKWCLELEEYGYVNSYAILNAKDYGIPQNRERCFMVSVKKGLEPSIYHFPEPMKLHLRLKDLLETTVDEKYYLKQDFTKKAPFNSHTLNEILSELPKEDCFFDTRHRVIAKTSGILPFAITTRISANCQQFLKEGSDSESLVLPLNTMPDGTCRTIKRQYQQTSFSNLIRETGSYGATGVINYEPILKIPEATCKGYAEVKPGGVFNGAYPESKTRRGRVIDNGDISPTIMTAGEPSYCYTYSFRIRKLTPKECFRLMGVSEEDIEKIELSGVSRSSQYKLAGNSIVVDCLYYIIKNLFYEPEYSSTLF